MKKARTHDIKPGKAIGLRIKQRRKELRISQERLAEALNVSYQQVQRYENGMNLLNTDKLQLVADFLDVPVSYFFEERGFVAVEETARYMPPDETRFLRLFKRLSNRDKEFVLRFMQLVQKKG
jgi:transcriptional regulator with XRE-family HTH domain